MVFHFVKGKKLDIFYLLILSTKSSCGYFFVVIFVVLEAIATGFETHIVFPWCSMAHNPDIWASFNK